MTTFNETELVALLKDVPENGLNRGDVGTVAFVYDGGDLYEVEFINAAGDTVAVMTLTNKEVCAVELERAILHVAQLPTQHAA